MVYNLLLLLVGGAAGQGMETLASILEAMEKAMEWGDKIPLGILYKGEKPDFHDKLDFLKNGKSLVDCEFDLNKISGFMNDFR